LRGINLGEIELKVLYTVNKVGLKNELVGALNNQEDWEVSVADSRGQVLTLCSTRFFDVIVIDAAIPDFPWLETIKTIRERQIFTPILVLTDEYNEINKTAGLEDGADMCMSRPFTCKELMLRIRVLKRRNTNFQSLTIDFYGLELNRPNGKLCYQSTSFSVSYIEIEVFRLLTRATTPIDIKKLSEKINESEERIAFCAQSLQKKIGLLNGPVALEIKNQRCRLVKKK
jgi:two-component system OmpR family response regulator